MLYGDCVKDFVKGCAGPRRLRVGVDFQRACPGEEADCGILGPFDELRRERPDKAGCFSRSSFFSRKALAEASKERLEALNVRRGTAWVSLAGESGNFFSSLGAGWF